MAKDEIKGKIRPARIIVARTGKLVDLSRSQQDLWDEVREGNKTQSKNSDRKDKSREIIRQILNKKIRKKQLNNAKISVEEKIASVHIDFDKDNILPELNEEDLNELGVRTNKSVLLKKNVIDRNELRHNDLTLEDSEKIISQALYSKDKTIIPSKYSNKPHYHTFAKIVRVSKKDGQPVYGVVLLDVDISKENFEIVHWHYVPQDKLDSIKPKG